MAPALPPSADYRPRAQTCIFDMDGVLVDSGVWHRAAWAALLDELGTEPSRPDYWRLTIGRPSEEAIPLLLGRTVPDGEAYRLARRKRDLYMRLSRQGLRAVPGALTFVAELARRGVPRAVGTSASSWDVDNILAAVGLLRHFAVVVTADDVSFGKPDPEVYVLAARRLHADPVGCVVFEDSVVGIHAALAAGMRVIGVSTAYDEAELLAAGAERVVNDFEGLAWDSIASP
jgi:HAD superfamily hydrolase (TIGR01509 family)